MRKALLAALALASVAAFGTGSAEAAPYRYCLQEGNQPGPGTCYYSTYGQCMASASGRRAYCQLNPFYAFAEQNQVVRPRKVYRDRRYYD